MIYRLGVNNPKVWGPTLWDKFFKRASNYPEKNPTYGQRKLFKDYYKHYLNNLPCMLCTPSYKRFWREVPIDNYLDSRRDLIMWLYLIKDKVNKKLTNNGTFKKSPPFGTVLKKYY